MKTFYNTTNESGQILIDFVAKAKSQDEIILNFFKTNNHEEFTPDEVQENTSLKNVPVTSIRRSITNLTSEGLLEKTGIKKMGKYGRLTFTWKLKK